MLFDSGCVICERTPGPVCSDCREYMAAPAAMTLPGFARCRVAFRLDDRSRPVIAAYKYRKQRRIARWLGYEMAPSVPRAADVITWVPATPERRRSRGYDQAQELARVLGRLTGVPTARLLRRDRHDVRQTGRSRADRLGGPLLHATGVSPPFVVLVDDVITTGSSMRSAALALGAASGSAEPQRIVGVAAAATPALGDVCLHDLTNTSSIREWT